MNEAHTVLVSESKDAHSSSPILIAQRKYGSRAGQFPPHQKHLASNPYSAPPPPLMKKKQLIFNLYS